MMAFYLSLKTMYGRAKKAQIDWSIYYHNDEKKLPHSLVESYELYQLSTRQYLGLGKLFQYIPGTQANKARKQLIDELEPTLIRLKKNFEAEPENNFRFPGLLFVRLTYRLSLSSYFNFSFLIACVHNTFSDFKNIFATLHFNAESVITQFPLLNGTVRYLYKKYREQELADLTGEENSKTGKLSSKKIITHLIKDLLHLALNPPLFFRNTVRFFFFSFVFVIDNILPDIIGTPIKGLVALCSAIVKLPINILLFAWSVPAQLIELVVINPLIHFTESALDAYQHQGKNTLFATVNDFQNIKELRRSAKKHENTSYTVIQKVTSNTEYIGITKSKLYTENTTNPEQLVAIRAKTDKIKKSSLLLSIFKSAETKESAVEEARTALGLN